VTASDLPRVGDDPRRAQQCRQKPDGGPSCPQRHESADQDGNCAGGYQNKVASGSVAGPLRRAPDPEAVAAEMGFDLALEDATVGTHVPGTVWTSLELDVGPTNAGLAPLAVANGDFSPVGPVADRPGRFRRPLRVPAAHGFPLCSARLLRLKGVPDRAIRRHQHEPEWACSSVVAAPGRVLTPPSTLYPIGR